MSLINQIILLQEVDNKLFEIGLVIWASPPQENSVSFLKPQYGQSIFNILMPITN